MNAVTAAVPVDPADTRVGVESPSSAIDPSLATLPATRMAVDARGLALGILAALAALFALSWAQGFVVPLLLGIVISYTLNPLVAWLEAVKIPRVAGTLIVMTSVIGGLALGTYSLRGEVQTIIEQLPVAATKFAAGLARMQISQTGNIQKMQSAATQVEKATTQAAGGGTTPRQPATHVIVDEPTFKLGNFLWQSSMGALGAMGQAAMIVFLVFFLLLGGDTFKRKLVRLTGPSLSKRKITVHILDDINGSIQKYMLMLLTTNLLVALLSWIVFSWIGLENAGAWAAWQEYSTSFLTWVPASPPSLQEWRHSCNSSRLEWRCWLPERRYRSRRSWAPS